MKSTIISVTIYEYAEPMTHFYHNDNGKVTIDSELPLREAQLLMWHLIKQGGKVSYESNPYRPSIATREVRLFCRE